jgi:predicted membrane-bound spermidine synthase
MRSTIESNPVSSRRALETAPYYLLFFLSGCPALLYQIVWQRALFTIYGVNIESVTVIVTVFMLGLGLGSLMGGWLSSAKRLPSLALFGLIETSIGVFGFFSLGLFHRVASFTSGSSTVMTGIATAFLLIVPTLLMGSTLPLLVAHFVRVNRNVGETVGSLYSVNTLGSAVACILAALLIMRLFGESGTVRLAACMNAFVGASTLLLQWFAPCNREPDLPLQSPDRDPAAPSFPFAVGLLLSALVGFISLAYEIVWYRLYAFASGDRAASFALLLGFYLAGIAYGSLVVRDVCRDKLRSDLSRALSALATLILWAGIAGFLVGPALANALRYVAYPVTFTFVWIGATLLGAAFPLLSHIAIRSLAQAGRSLSYIYLANIIGSASGSFLIGFILMDYWPIQTISLFLLGLSAITVIALLLTNNVSMTRSAIGGLATTLALFLFSGQLFSQFYEKMLFKSEFTVDQTFRHVTETRNGIIAVSQDGIVFGGGVYDGRFNTDLNHDTNGIFRAFALAAFHPHLSEVLMIGLSSGSWAQVIANHPDVQRLTIIEINPGYLRLIAKYPQVAGLLNNPKVAIHIDDGRRWLVRNPGRKFDAIVMNASFNWRAHNSNLLSTEFLQLVRAHLKPGGIHYYNTTMSAEVLLTGATVFPYSLRVWNFLAVSDRPIVVDKSRWASCLAQYRIDGRSVFDLADSTQRARLNEVVSLVDTLDSGDPAREKIMERGDSLRRRVLGKRIVTDDNMGTEWK